MADVSQDKQVQRPLSECNLFLKYAGDWPDLPLTTITRSSDSHEKAERVQLDRELDEFLDPGPSESLPKFAVGSTGKRPDDGLPHRWVFGLHGVGAIWRDGDYAGWARARQCFLETSVRIGAARPGRQAESVLLRYVDEFPVNSPSELLQFLKWPVAAGLEQLLLMRGDVPFHFPVGKQAGTVRGRVRYALVHTAVSGTDDSHEGLKGLLLITTSAHPGPKRHVALENGESLGELLDFLHHLSKKVFWDCLTPDYREQCGSLFSDDERRQFSEAEREA